MRHGLYYIAAMTTGAIVSGLFFGLAGAVAWMTASLILSAAGMRL